MEPGAWVSCDSILTVCTYFLSVPMYVKIGTRTIPRKNGSCHTAFIEVVSQGYPLASGVDESATGPAGDPAGGW